MGRPKSAVDLTEELLRKIKAFKNIPGLSFSLDQDNRPGRAAKIRIRLRNPKPGYTGPISFSFDATPEGFKQAKQKFNELKPSVGKVQTLKEIGDASNKLKTDYNNLKKTYTDDLVKWLNTNAADEKYQFKGGVNKLYKDAFKEFNKGKYIQIPKTGATGSDAWLKNNLFIKMVSFNFQEIMNFYQVLALEVIVFVDKKEL